MLRFLRTYISTDNYFNLRVMLADAMRSMDVPRDPGSLTRTFPSRVMCSQLVYLYIPDPVSHVFSLYRFGLSTHLCLPFHFMLTSFVSSTRLQSRYSWTIDSCPHLRLVFLFTDICNCISQFTIYTGWR